VCIVTETFPPEVNGVAHTGRLVDGLRDRGTTVSIVRPRPRGVDDVVSTRGMPETLVAGVPLPRYPGLQLGLPAGRLLRTVWGARRPDALYVATEGPLGWSASRAAVELSLPVLSGFHTNFHSYARHYAGGWLRGSVMRYLRWFHNRTDGTVVATDELRVQLETAGFRNVSVLGRGVDTSLFTPARRSAALRATWGAYDDDVVVLHVGRLAPEKNIPLVVDAYRAIRETGHRVRCVLVGDGPLRRELQTTHPDIVFCGVQRGETLAAHYASADVFLFASETETFGNVVLEALASGLAVLAYDYAAARAHIEHGDNGLLVPYGDRRVFVQGAVAMGCHVAGLRALRSRARSAVLPFDWPRVIERFERLVDDTCARKGARPPADLDAVNGRFVQGGVV
jgi:glycosyltransferase involved in cell wall biosynthesis